jgi:hypothetical protein
MRSIGRFCARWRRNSLQITGQASNQALAAKQIAIEFIAAYALFTGATAPFHRQLLRPQRLKHCPELRVLRGGEVDAHQRAGLARRWCGKAAAVGQCQLDAARAWSSRVRKRSAWRVHNWSAVKHLLIESASVISPENTKIMAAKGRTRHNIANRKLKLRFAKK